ncbi:MAG: lytic murein transglycosylase [bacterium]
MSKKIIYLILILFIFKLPFVSAESNVFETLKQNLIKDGFDPEFIEKVYSRSYSEYISYIITINVKQSESGSNYVQFNKNSVIKKVKRYISKNNEFLIELYGKYNVPPEIICSILMVETKLGSYTGKYRVINIYSSMAASNTQESIDDIYKKYRNDAVLTDMEKLSREDVARKVKKKSDWAYSELKYFLKYVRDDNLDPYSVKGSFAGAFGLAQFIPSSFFNYAVDGNEDGKVDLFDHRDAMASIANYLKGNGWKNGLTKEEEKKVIATYNHSKYYVDAVSNMAARLK